MLHHVTPLVNGAGPEEVLIEPARPAIPTNPTPQRLYRANTPAKHASTMRAAFFPRRVSSAQTTAPAAGSSQKSRPITRPTVIHVPKMLLTSASGGPPADAEASISSRLNQVTSAPSTA